MLVLALVLSGCGSSSSSASSATKSSSSQDAARIKFAQCLRDNGVTIPDNAGQNGGGGAPQNIDRSKLQSAMKACQKFQQSAVGNISQSQRQEFRDAFTKFASCMRQQGVEVPDVGAGGGGGGPPAGGGAQINRNDPKFKAAQTACQNKLPKGIGGGGPGGGPGGG